MRSGTNRIDRHPCPVTNKMQALRQYSEGRIVTEMELRQAFPWHSNEFRAAYNLLLQQKDTEVKDLRWGNHVITLIKCFKGARDVKNSAKTFI